MRKLVLGLGAATLALSLSACGATDQPENNIAAGDLNAVTNLEELPPVEPASNDAVENTVADTRPSEPAAAKPAGAEPAPAKPKPTPARPEPRPAAEANAQEPTCAPEHRALGHC